MTRAEALLIARAGARSPDRHEAIVRLADEGNEAVVLAILEVAFQLERVARTLEIDLDRNGGLA